MENVGLPGGYGRLTRLIKRALRSGRLYPELQLAECSSCGAAVLGPQPPERCPTCGWALDVFSAEGQLR
jgi:rubrerythrin